MLRRALPLLVVLLSVAGSTTSAAPARAAAGDPDPAFGTGGVALVPGTNRLSGQGAPLVQSDGRIVATSLLSSGDVLFLSRFTAAGQPDTTFGTGSGSAITKGTTTGIKAPLKRAATALGPGDQILVAGGSRSGGTITVGRFTKDGALDRTFNRTGKLTVHLRGRKPMLPTAMLARPDGSVLVTVLGDVGGTYGFTVVRITPAGTLDTTWGAGRGWVQVPVGHRPAAAFDLAPLSDGSLVLAGGVLDAARSNPTDTAIVKLDADGRPAAGFGTGGVVTHDLSPSGNADGALGIVPLATGGFFVSGPSGSQGMVARFTSTGALDSQFGSGGTVFSGLVPAGARFVPVDVALDGSGRPVVAGTVFNHGGMTTATRWGIVRLAAAGTDPVASSSTPEQCSNRAGRGPSGVTGSGNRILVAGSCNDKGTSAVMALVGRTFEPALTAEVDAASLPAGYQTIRLRDLDPAATLTAAQTIQSAPFRFSPFRFSPFRFSPFRFSPFRFSPFRFSPFRFSGGAFDRILLSDIPLRNGQAWADLLPAPFDEAPLQTITLRQVIDLPQLGDLTFEDFDWSRTPIADISLAALLLYPVPVREFAPPAGRSAWPEPDETFLDLELSGQDLTAYYRDHLQLAGVDFGARTLNGGTFRSYIAEVPLTAIDLTRTPLHPVNPGGATDLGELLQSLPRTGAKNATLGQLLLTFIDEDDIPFERAPRRLLLDAADLRDTQLLRYTVRAEVDCPSGAHLLEVTLPGDARYKAGSSTLGEPAGTGPLTFDLCRGASAGARSITLQFDAEPGSALGPTDATMRLVGTTLVRTLPAEVVDADGDGAALVEGVMRTGHIATARDVDTFAIPAPPVGSQVTVTLSQLRADLDLEVTGPPIDDTATVEESPFRFSPFRFSPFRFSPVPDPTGDPVDTSVVSPNAVQDAPFRFSDARRGVSVKRGTADESVSFVSREGDQGQTFTVHVAGFDGATSGDAYVVRSIVTEAPEPPDCIPARVGLDSAAPGALPGGIPRDTRTLVLYNEQRMRGLYPRSDVDAMLDTIRSRYLDRPEVAGELLAVDGDGSVRAAYGAWDRDPCSVQAADGVVQAINDLVDGYRVNGGLPQLRNVVLLGPDAALPQKRVADESRLANARTFAEEMVFGGVDDPVSRALREGYFFTDDDYGDFDPQSLGTRTLYVPDVALGRLLETPEQIRAAFDAYADNDGVMGQQTAYVAGYDFLTDATDVIFDGLQPLSFRQQPVKRTDDWDAAAGLAGMDLASGISSVNAHFDTYRALPARDFFEGSGGLFSAAQADPSPRTLLFTIGCHSGLNVAAAGLAGAAAGDPRLQDWTERVAGSGAVWIGESSYGLGDSVTVAYSERLMSSFAALVGREESNLGQSLMFAKQDYAATSLGLLDDYDVKAVQEAVYYGLPTYVTEGGQAAAATPAVQTSARAARPAARASAAGAQTADAAAASARFEFRSAHVRETTERGEFWRVGDEEPLVIARRPIQPRWTTDVTAADRLPVHGALVDHLEMTEERGIDPVIARPIVDLAEHEPEPDVLDAPFPATLAAVSPVLEPDGRHDRLTLFTGQFRPEGTDGRGTQRLYTVMRGRALRSDSLDYDPPRIRLTDTAFAGTSTVAFGVEIVPGDDATGGVVLYRTGDESTASTTWQSATLTPAGADRLGASAVLPAGDDRVVEWIAQVTDAAGNVGVSTNKVLGYTARPTPPPPGEPAVELEGATLGSSGAYGAPPTISLVNAGDATWQRSIDGGDWAPYSGPFTPDALADGVHTVALRSSTGGRAERSFIVDTLAPTITAAPRTAPGPGGWWTTDVTVDFFCADAGAGVTPGDCPAPLSITAEGATTVTRAITDRAGRSSGDVEFGPYRIDRTEPAAPQVDDPDGDDAFVTLAGEDELTGTAADPLSGVREVVVGYEETDGDADYPDPGKDRQLTRTFACDGAATCSWSVERPPDGLWTARVRAYDVAGNEGPESVVTVSSSAPCFDCDGPGAFAYGSFDDPAGLQLNGDAHLTDAEPPDVDLTVSVPSQKGSVYRRQPVSTALDFTVAAEFDVLGQADGLAFVLQRDPEAATGLGAHGGGMGYAFLRPSVAVEYDAFGNWDVESPSSHVAVTRDGDHLTHLDEEPFPVAGGRRCTVIEYDAAARRLDATVHECEGESEPATASVSVDIDLREAVGDTAFIGWSASTGALTARHRLLRWTYESAVPDVEVVNGGFEEPDVETGNQQQFAAGIPGWTLAPSSAGTAIEVQDRLFGYLPDSEGGGDQWVELDADAPTRIEQDVTTVPGQTYRLTYRHSPRPGLPAADDDYWVQVAPADGRAPGQWTTWRPTPVAGGAQTDWHLRDGVFTADTDRTTIAFQDLGPSNGVGPFIDDVRVEPAG